MSLNESIVEDAAIEWFLLRPIRQAQDCDGQVGELVPRLREVGHGVSLAVLLRARTYLAPGEPAAERDSFGEVVQSCFARTLTRPLPAGEGMGEAIRRLNPAIPGGVCLCVARRQAGNW